MDRKEIQLLQTSTRDRFVALTAQLIGEFDAARLLQGKGDLFEVWDLDRRIPVELDAFFQKREWKIRHQEFNEILQLLGSEPVSKWFFRTVFGEEISDVDHYQKKVHDFNIRAALRFGNFKYAFRFFAGIPLPKSEQGLQLERSAEEVWKEITLSKEDLELRLQNRVSPVIGIADIPREQRHFVSELSKAATPEQKNIRRIARHNSALYLTRDFIDVYVATSMRTKGQFQNVTDVIQGVFKRLEDLNVRYFDPTLSDANSNRIIKGLIEALMLKRARATLYLAQEGDSLGKDSELASTLAQGKDVIVLVPEVNVADRAKELHAIFNGDQWQDDLKMLRTLALGKVNKNPAEAPIVCKRILSAFSETEARALQEFSGEIAVLEKEFFDSRATLLKDIHPLGVQVNLETGVANGVIVVRTEDEAANMLRASLLNSHRYELDLTEVNTEQRMVRVLEQETKSVVRIISTDKFFTKAFWTHYLRMTDPYEERHATATVQKRTA